MAFVNVRAGNRGFRNKCPANGVRFSIVNGERKQLTVYLGPDCCSKLGLAAGDRIQLLADVEARKFMVKRDPLAGYKLSVWGKDGLLCLVSPKPEFLEHFIPAGERRYTTTQLEFCEDSIVGSLENTHNVGSK